MNRTDFEIEICAGNLLSVIEAAKGGADRVELCENLHEGGTTPSIGTIKVSKEISNIDVFTMIRPRGGNFVYNQTEFDVMLHDVKSAVEVGVDGIVIGCLKEDGSVDTEQCKRLIDAAKGLPVTFHRAFDVTADPFGAIDELKKLGVQRILTAGQTNEVVDGLDMIKKLHEYAGDDIRIMAGSGIRENNIQQIATASGIKSFHASMRSAISISSAYSYSAVRFNSGINMPENSMQVSSSTRIKTLITMLEELAVGCEL